MESCPEVTSPLIHPGSAFSLNFLSPWGFSSISWKFFFVSNCTFCIFSCSAHSFSLLISESVTITSYTTESILGCFKISSDTAIVRTRPSVSGTYFEMSPSGYISKVWTYWLCILTFKGIGKQAWAKHDMHLNSTWDLPEGQVTISQYILQFFSRIFQLLPRTGWRMELGLALIPGGKRSCRGRGVLRLANPLGPFIPLFFL